MENSTELGAKFEFWLSVLLAMFTWDKFMNF